MFRRPVSILKITVMRTRDHKLRVTRSLCFPYSVQRDEVQFFFNLLDFLYFNILREFPVFL